MKLIDLAHAVATESAREFSPDSFLEDLVVIRGRDYWGDATPGWVWNGNIRGEALTADLQLEDRFILFEEVGHYPISCIFFLKCMDDLENRILAESGFFNSFTTNALAFVDGALRRFECFSLDEYGKVIPFKKDEQVGFGVPSVRKLRWL
jgi:hypothetical protein